MLLFATLGPAGSNHEWVTNRYLAFHRLTEAEVRLVPDFEAAFDALLAGEVKFVVQVAVHPSVTSSVARYRGRAHLVDTFISPSQPMAVLTRTEVANPSSLGLQAATREYVDTSRWDTLVPEPSTVAVGAGLLEGKYDSGITLARYREQYPDRFRVEQAIGSVVDPWLVYATRAVCEDGLLAWPDSPATRLFHDDGP